MLDFLLKLVPPVRRDKLERVVGSRHKETVRVRLGDLYAPVLILDIRLQSTQLRNERLRLLCLRFCIGDARLQSGLVTRL